MVGSLANRAICELIRTDNAIGLKSFLETRADHVDDRDEVNDSKLDVQDELLLKCLF
jgi:hypothetical protein